MSDPNQRCEYDYDKLGRVLVVREGFCPRNLGVYHAEGEECCCAPAVSLTRAELSALDVEEILEILDDRLSRILPPDRARLRAAILDRLGSE